MTNTALLESRIDASGYKKNYIAKMLGITPYALALKIRNQNEFKASEIRLLCNLLRIESWEEKDAIFFAQ